MSDHKYIKREWRNGRWRYYYSSSAPGKGRNQVMANTGYRIVSQDENGMRLGSRHGNNSKWLKRFQGKARSSGEDRMWNMEENYWDRVSPSVRKKRR